MKAGNGGGASTVAIVENTNIKVNRCNGAAECKKALLLMKVGKLNEDFIEGMACVGGCVGGPARNKNEMEAKEARDMLIGNSDDRKVLENLGKYNMDKFSMHRH